MERRDFIRQCAIHGIASSSAVAMASQALAQATKQAQTQPMSIKKFTRSKLVNAQGDPIKAAQLKTDINYIFEYPFIATPCFLLKLSAPLKAETSLKTQAGESYVWTGGVGPANSLVAYSAICQHKLAYPSKQVNFISFQKQAGLSSSNKTSIKTQDKNVIACCADGSVYDATAGAKVIAGPAEQALTTIVLEYDTKSDEIYAIGVLGGDKFEAFFKKYAFKLQLERGKTARNEAGNTTTLIELSKYSTQSANC